jgi:putative transposase
MPRQARIDIAGQLYHVMSRGIERGKIFVDEVDYADFVERMGVWLKESGAKCLAWCLIPNHFHFLILRGHRPLSELMHRVMTGYAVNFNGRHRRAGHLFQNRYKAIICDTQEYLFELVPYIHLNPLRARLVADLAELEGYKWCGHPAVLGGAPCEILDRQALLEYFDDTENVAIAKYKTLMAEKARERPGVNLSGGGLKRSLKAAGAMTSKLRPLEKTCCDQRILGRGDFVEAILRNAGEIAVVQPRSRAELLAAVEKATGVPKEEILRPSHMHAPARARAIYCYLCRERSRISGTELTRELRVVQSAVARLAAKGRQLVEAEKLVI